MCAALLWVLLVQVFFAISEPPESVLCSPYDEACLFQFDVALAEASRYTPADRIPLAAGLALAVVLGPFVPTTS